jgi:hypothetical protein
MNLTYDKVKSVFKAKGYKFYEGPLNLNIFGVRSANLKANLFDDFIGVAYQKNSENRVHLWEATTDPGNHWLQHPLSVKGTAILVPGQYPVYAIDYHRGAYEALCQRRGPVRVYRDNNRDTILDFDAPTQTGSFGINIHRANPRGVTPRVERHSAGCQVFEDAHEFDCLMALAYDSKKIYGNKFTYTLFLASDFA